MNYLKIYEQLIKSAEKRNISEEIYSENHHIIPKSIFDYVVQNRMLNNFRITHKNDSNNLIKLLPREHYLAHILLVKIFKNNKNCYEKMVYAANFMCNRIHSSRKYASLKEAHSQILKNKLTGKTGMATGSKWSKKRRLLGQPHLRGKTYEEIYGKEKAEILRSERRKKRSGHSEETRKKLSLIVKGEMWRKKISETKRGVPLSESTRLKIKSFFNDPSKNPKVDKTMYKFYNIDGRCIVARRYDMRKIHKCELIHKLIRGEQKHCNGWYFKGEIIS